MTGSRQFIVMIGNGIIRNTAETGNKLRFRKLRVISCRMMGSFTYSRSPSTGSTSFERHVDCLSPRGAFFKQQRAVFRHFSSVSTYSGYARPSGCRYTCLCFTRNRRRMGTMYDVIVLGARCGGSPAAMLLARKGYRVLVVDRATFPSDTVSTH